MRMCFGLMIAAALIAIPPAACADRDDDADRAIARAERSFDADNFSDARQILERLMAQRSFSTLSPTIKHSAVILLAVIDQRDPGCEAALLLDQEATQAADAGERAWAALFAQLYVCEDYPNAGATLTTVIERYPNVAAGLGTSQIYRLTPI